MRTVNARRIVLASPLLAIVAQLLTAAVAVASTTGGGFPGLQR
jgi:hypothetical protein